MRLKPSLSIRVVATAALIFIASKSLLRAQTANPFRFDESAGEYGVGLRVVQQYDYSRVYIGETDAMGRPYRGERARPLQTLIWYPAEKSSAQTMTVEDYVNLLPSETDFIHPQMPTLWMDFIKGVQQTLPAPMWAVRDAKPVAGHFPLVIYAPSISSMSWENADLCEYLASHGYVVIASPDFGTSTRRMSNDLKGIESETNDIEFLIGYAQTLQEVDMSKIAVAAFSWGGLANVFAAAKDTRIGAMVELDSSLRYYPGFVKDAGYVHPDQMKIPMLYLSHGELSVEGMARLASTPGTIGPNVLNEWTHGDLVAVNMRGLVHGEFSSMFQRNENFWTGVYVLNHVADYTREDGAIGYAWIARYVLAFLNAYMKEDAYGMAFLQNSPAQNGAPSHFISVDYRKAKGLPATLDTLRVEAGKQGFEHIAQIYAAMKRDSNDFKPDPIEMSAWADELSASGHYAATVEILKLNLQINPDTKGADAAIGDAYMQLGQKEKAIENYKLQLKKTPLDFTTAEKLKTLER